MDISYSLLISSENNLHKSSFPINKVSSTKIPANTIFYNVKPIRQKQMPVNPKIEPLMRNELSKLIEAYIIFPIKHSSWVENLVPVRKRNGEIRLCVDFRDLNQASLKDHHPLPSME